VTGKAISMPLSRNSMYQYCWIHSFWYFMYHHYP